MSSKEIKYNIKDVIDNISETQKNNTNNLGELKVKLNELARKFDDIISNQARIISELDEILEI